ncbi:MAG: LCP family protein [Bacilli bacterium]
MEDNNIFIQEENTKKKKINGKKIIINIMTILTLLACGLLIGSIYMVSGVENTIRYIAMIVIFIVNIVLILLMRKLFKSDKKSKVTISIILSIVLIIIQSLVGYFIIRTYSTLSNMNKSKITYTTVIATKSESKLNDIKDLNDQKIGIVVDETSIDGYIIGLEIIDEQNLEKDNTIVEYTDFSSLVKDLYDSKIDAMIISKNYPSMFKSMDDYKNIEQETKIIYEKSKTLTKDEISKYTGEEMVNFNTSDKIDKPFTVLVMGIDSTASTLSKNATGNGDALMMVTFNPKTLNATIFSIPRDTYVPIACFENQKENKITHAAWNGESCMIKTIENFTGIDIDYYVKINFQGVVKLVEALNGISVDVPLDFCESNSKRSTKSENLICLKKGVQTLNGEEALALARHRKTLTTGDLQRGVNQQLVVQGILNKLKSVKSANQMLNILDTVSQNMDTNFTTKQILSFYDIAKNLFLTSTTDNLINMKQLYLQGASQMIYDEGLGLTLYNYIPNQESLDLVISAMKQNLELEEIKQVKKMEFSIEEPFKLETVGSNVETATKTYTLLPNFVGESESYARSWLSSNGISVTTTTKEVSSGYYDGQIIDQSYPENKRLDLISGSVNLTVAKVKKVETTKSTTTNNSSNSSNSSNSNNNSSSEENTNNDDTSNSEDKNSGDNNTLPDEIIS